MGSSPAGGAGQEFDKAFDGDVGTFFHYSSKSFGFTGLDLGAGNAKRVSKVRFYPRSGFASRMFTATGDHKAMFQGSNEAPATVDVIASVESSDGRAVSYTYDTMLDPVFAHDWVVLTGAVYGDGTAAAYEYTQPWPGIQPLMSSANDPRVGGHGSQMRYEWWQDAHVTGNLKAEKNFVTHAPIATLESAGMPTTPTATALA